MRDTYDRVFVHLVWATWDRAAIIMPDWREAPYLCIQSECNNMKADVQAIGGTEDHVHLLVHLPLTVAVSALVKQVKGASSHLVTHRLTEAGLFKWQGSYGAISVSPEDISRICAYIHGQAQHHQANTLRADLELSDSA